MRADGTGGQLNRGVAHVFVDLWRERDIDAVPRLNAECFLCAGAEDPVGDYGRGVFSAFESFCAAGMKDVSIKLYGGARHDILHELNKAEVFEDILAFISRAAAAERNDK